MVDGERWPGRTSNLIRGRLMSLAQELGYRPGGPLAVLACAPGEQHDLPLVAFGLALRAAGAGGSRFSGRTRRR